MPHPMLITLQTDLVADCIVLTFNKPLTALALDYEECLAMCEQLSRRTQNIKPSARSPLPTTIRFETDIVERRVVLIFAKPITTLPLDHETCLAMREDLLRRAQDIKATARTYVTKTVKKAADYDNPAQA